MAIQPASEQRSSLLWLALLIAASAAIWVQGGRINDAYAVEEDFRKFHYMHRFQQPELYPVDSMTPSYVREYSVGSLVVIADTSSPGYSLLFQAASYLVSVVTFSKIIGIPLLLLSVYYLYRIGERLRGPGTGLGLALAFATLNLASPASLTVLTGLQRSFMAPLVLAVLYYLLIGRDWAAAIALILGGLFYLPAFALAAATYGLTLLSWNYERRRPQLAVRRVRPLIVATALVLTLHVPTILRQIDSVPAARTKELVVTEPATAGIVSPEAAKGEAESSRMLSGSSGADGSRYELFRLFPLVGRAGLSDGVALAFYITVLAAMSIFTFLLDRTSLVRLPREIKLLGVAGGLCFALAWGAYLLTGSFALYLPNRYSQAALFFLTLIYVVVNFDETVQRTVSGLHANRSKVVWLALPASLIVILLALFLPPESLGAAIAGGTLRWALILLAIVLFVMSLALRRRSDPVNVLSGSSVKWRPSNRVWALFGGLLLLIGLGNIWVMQSRFLVSSLEERELYRFLESLPTDSLVSGNPCDLDGVPLFAKRMVLFSCERPRSDEIALDTLLAYYAEEPESIVAHCQRYGIDYLVVNKGSFERESLQEGNYYFEPINSQLRPVLSQQRTFAMTSFLDGAKVFENQSFAVVPCDGLALVNNDSIR